MCIIIDANAATELVQAAPAALPVRSGLEEGTLMLVSGGTLKQELLRSAFMRLYKVYLLAGRLTEIDSDRVAKEAKLDCMAVCRSNDGHVIALARVSGARILYSHDKALHADFKNKELLDKPRGVVYQKAAHAHVLREVGCSCVRSA